ncbi:hypothetical protein AHAS_Ahas01G0242900 [Arachis hypogaea]
MPATINAFQVGKPRLAEAYANTAAIGVSDCEKSFNGKSPIHADNIITHDIALILLGLGIIMAQGFQLKAQAPKDILSTMLSAGKRPDIRIPIIACLGTYNYLINTAIPEAIDAFKLGIPRLAQSYANMASMGVSDCERRFNGKSPITNENNITHEIALILGIRRGRGGKGESREGGRGDGTGGEEREEGKWKKPEKKRKKMKGMRVRGGRRGKGGGGRRRRRGKGERTRGGGGGKGKGRSVEVGVGGRGEGEEEEEGEGERGKGTAAAKLGAAVAVVVPSPLEIAVGDRVVVPLPPLPLPRRLCLAASPPLPRCLCLAASPPLPRRLAASASPLLSYFCFVVFVFCLVLFPAFLLSVFV